MAGQNRIWAVCAWLLACSFGLLSQPFSACGMDPYTAVVNIDKAELLSQPGKQGYITHYLVEGMEVEVYKKSEDGWLGIRPPEGCFSWIDSEHVQMTDEPGVGEVIKEDAPSWVGSAAETIARHHSQVKLPVGTKVEVLDKRRIATADGNTQIWLKIAPPPGEFRWIHAGEVRKQFSQRPSLASRTPTPAKRPSAVGSGVRSSLVPTQTEPDMEAIENEETDVVAAEESLDDEEADVALTGAQEDIGPRRKSVSRGARGVKSKSAPVRMNETLERIRDLGESMSENSLSSGEPGEFAPVGDAMPLEPLVTEPPVQRQPTFNSILANQGPAVATLPVEERNIIQQTAGGDDTSRGGGANAVAGGDGFVPRKRRTNEPLSPTGRASELSERPGVNSSLGGKSSSKGSSIPVTGLNEAAPNRLAKNTPSVPMTPRSLATNKPSEPLLSGGMTASAKEKLDQLELELSLMLSRPKETWNLLALQRRAEAIIDNGASPADRGQARIMLDKIKQFQTAFDVPAPSVAPTAMRGGVERATGPANNSPRYDYTGFLKPVFSREPGAAPYAIYDAEGHRLSFVSPAPGLNLNRYIDKEVGLYGRRGYIDALSTPHLSANRVVDLERHRR